MAPQQGVQYFISGAAGQLRPGDLQQGDPLVAKGYDADSHFMVAAVDHRGFRFRAINTANQIVDKGVIAADVRPQTAPPGRARPRAKAAG